ncbi:hypothetical protein SVIOM342S_01262 [Streptomyces violaceorubidus]
MLLDALAGTVRWGHKVRAARSLGDGRHEVAFADGTSVVTSLLVGADGAWSRVRPLVSGAMPEYVGMSFVETWMFDADVRHPATAKAVGDGAMFALAPGKAIQAHRETGGTLHAYVALRKPREWFDGVDLAGATGAARVAGEFAGWAPELTALITDADTAPVLRPLHTLPAAHRWERVPGVTLLGDAAHLMPPSGVVGRDLAKNHSGELGRALAAHLGDTEAGGGRRGRTGPVPAWCGGGRRRVPAARADVRRRRAVRSDRHVRRTGVGGRCGGPGRVASRSGPVGRALAFRRTSARPWAVSG